MHAFRIKEKKPGELNLRTNAALRMRSWTPINFSVRTVELLRQKAPLRVNPQQALIVDIEAMFLNVAGVVYSDMGNATGAIEAYTFAIYHHQDHVRALYNSAVIFQVSASLQHLRSFAAFIVSVLFSWCMIRSLTAVQSVAVVFFFFLLENRISFSGNRRQGFDQTRKDQNRSRTPTGPRQYLGKDLARFDLHGPG